MNLESPTGLEEPRLEEYLTELHVLMAYAYAWKLKDQEKNQPLNSRSLSIR